MCLNHDARYALCLVLLPLLVVSVGATNGFAQNGPLFHFSEKPGTHAVGLKIVEQYDNSRSFGYRTDDLGKPYQGKRSRPLQTLIWYPARPSDAKAMTVGDYVNITGTELTFGRPQSSTRVEEWRSAVGLTLRTPLWAVRDAPLAPGRFPLIIYAPGASEMAWSNADLCEYLASHGYVVISSPDMGARSRSMTIDLAGIDAEVRDISFLIGYAQTLPDVDISKVAVIGASFGGISNVFAAARDNRIDALVALDGSVRYAPGLVKRAGDVHPEEMSIPLLFFVQRNFSLEDQSRYLTDAWKDGPNVLNAWSHGDLTVVHMLGLSHAEFSSMQQRNENMWWEEMWWDVDHLRATEQVDYGPEEASLGYGWVARYTLQFLDAYLKRNSEAMTFLVSPPGKNGVPQHVMTVHYRAATAAPSSFEEFRAAIGQQGFDHLDDVYAAFHKRKPDFKLEEMFVFDWADELIGDNHLREAIALLKLNLQMHPDSSTSYATLGDAYLKFGQSQLAIDSYRGSLERDATNGVAQRKIGELSRALH
jgi:dienelactone hydrolase